MSAQLLTFHHLNHSQSQRILWLLEELQAPYELKLHARYSSGPKKSRAPDELKETHPLGKSPQLITPEGRVIIESVAIATYLIRTYDTEKKFQGDPSTGNDDIRDESLSSFANASISVGTVIETVFDAIAKQAPFFIRWFFTTLKKQIHNSFTGPEFEAQFKYLSDQLGDQDYFMGSSPGRADFMLSWPFDYVTQRKYYDISKYPNLQQWHARCHARDGWKRGLSKGNGYDFANGLM